MKHFILTALCLFSIFAIGQKNVTLNFDHKLNNSSTVLNAVGTNNIGHDFKLTRIHYYVSQIILVHDGGQETPISNTWMLVDVSEQTSLNLGSYPITVLEAIKFAVGVEAAVNHSDPSTYPASHPLAPQMPSMHWGWTSGYRFIAMEGMSGANFGYGLQIHGLGDANYYPLTINTAGIANGNDLNINITANYEGILHGMNLSSGFIMHGETDQAKDGLINMTKHVFKSSEGNASLGQEEEALEAVSIFPNPSHGELFIQSNGKENVAVSVYDLLGNLVFNVDLNEAITPINLQDNGVYFMTISSGAELLQTEKIIITK